MSGRFPRGLWLVGVCALLAACTKVPITGRRQYNVVPESIMVPLGTSTWQSMMTELDTVERGQKVETVEQVGRRIARASRQRDYDWEFSLIQDDQVNAWCLPGGKVGVYTGLLPVARSEAGLAFIMGHEVAHAVAHHSAERLSQQLTLVGGIAALNMYLRDRTALSEQQRATILAALGVGAQVGVLLPYSRTHEQEADVIGLMYMARAGYPPQESVDVWRRMEEAGTGGNVPVFLSTHPSHEQRIATLRDWMPRAQKRYRRNRVERNTTDPLWR